MINKINTEIDKKKHENVNNNTYMPLCNLFLLPSYIFLNFQLAPDVSYHWLFFLFFKLRRFKVELWWHNYIMYRSHVSTFVIIESIKANIAGFSGVLFSVFWQAALVVVLSTVYLPTWCWYLVHDIICK